MPWLWSTGVFAVETIPVPVSGNVRFTNRDPAFPGMLGLSSIAADASSLAPSRLAGSGYLVATGTVDTDYRILMDAQDAPPGGTEYQLSFRLYLFGGRGLYTIPARPVRITPGPGLSGINASECAGVFHVRFMNASGEPVSVARGTVSCPRAQLALLPGSHEDNFVVPGDTGFLVTATVTLGSGDTALQYVLTTNALSACDRTVPIDFVVPSPPGLGGIRGELDLVGESEALWGDATIGDPANTRISATGPGGTVRRYTFPLRSIAGGGMSESSGPFNLPNLPPNDLVAMPAGYTVQAEMGIRRFRQFEYFATPGLGMGMNPGPTVVAKSVLDIGSTFVMTPGYVNGSITLSGPRETAGGSYRSPLRGISFSTDGTSDGLPSRSIYGNYGSTVVARGLDRPAPGATYTAAGAVAEASFDGSYEPRDGLWRGSYELALAGLSGEASLWRPDGLGLRLFSGGITNPATYVDESLSLTDERIPDQEITPGGRIRVDRQYQFGQVCIRFHSAGAQLWDPRLWLGSSGSGPGYTVNEIVANGTPLSPDTAAEQGTLVLILPEGHYHLVPFVSADPTSETLLRLEPFDLDIIALQQQCITPCLRVDFDLPPCTASSMLNVKGIVRTLCDNQVKLVTYRIDDGPEIMLCSACGANPSLGFGLTLPGGDCSEHDITITATDSNGEVASNTQHIRLDSQPPTINCPKDLIVECLSPAGTRVDYATPVATDNCPGLVRVVCTPPPGSLFPPGDTIVRCVATDPCGNTAECKFTIHVNGQCTSCQLACPPDMTVECITPNGAPVNYPFPILSGDCPTGAMVLCDPPSGSFFPLGTNAVHCFAIGPDKSVITDCKFFITVRCSSTGQCHLLCPSDMKVNCSSPAGSVVTYSSPTLSGECSPGATVFCDPPSGSLFPMGQTIVTCRAKDATGSLLAQCQFTVFVESQLTIESAVLVRWNCGILQSAIHLTGPWTDVPGATSPFCAPSTGDRVFYRIR